MAEKMINTRIQLKYDTLVNWESSNPVLKAGEVAVVAIASGNTQIVNSVTAPQCLMKVGDGSSNFKALPYISALAADVYSWAKAANAPDEYDTKYAFEIKDGKLQVTETTHTNGQAGTPKVTSYDFVTPAELTAILESYYTKTEVDGLIQGVKDIVNGLDESVTTVAKGTAIDVTDTGTGNDHAYTVALNVAGAKTALGLGSAAYVTVDSLNATAKGYADAVEAKLPTSADYGVLSVAKGDDTITIGGTAQNPTVKVTANKFDAYGAAAQALADAKKYADDNDTNTAHTHVSGKGIKVDNAGGISGAVKADLNIAFELVDKTIKLYDKDDTSKTAIATLDASEFIADGMLASVTADQTNNKLVFEWNTDAGVTKTEIALDAIADIYTGSTGNEVNVAVSNKNVISASLNSAIATKITNGATAYSWGNHASEGYLKAGNITGKADKVSNATSGNFAGLDANGNLTDSGKKASDFATSAQGATADSALQSVKVLGTTLTKSSNELTVAAAKTALGLKSAAYTESSAYATAAQGAKADSAVQSVSIATGSANGKIKLTVDGTETEASVKGLGSAAYTASTAYATAAQGGKADSALQSIEAGTGLTVSTKSNNKQTISIDDSVVFVFNCGNASTLID